MALSKIASAAIQDASITAADLASGAAKANFGAGAVLQCVTQTDTSTFTSSASSWVSTGLSCTFTPQSATSKIVVQFIGAYWQSTGGAYVGVKMVNTGGNTATPLIYTDLYVSSGAAITVPAPFTANFTSGTTSAITTTIWVYANGQGVWLNNNATTPVSPTVRSSWTIWEIAG
jgi:hypothetical protein